MGSKGLSIILQIVLPVSVDPVEEGLDQRWWAMAGVGAPIIVCVVIATYIHRKRCRRNNGDSSSTGKDNYGSDRKHCVIVSDLCHRFAYSKFSSMHAELAA